MISVKIIYKKQHQLFCIQVITKAKNMSDYVVTVAFLSLRVLIHNLTFVVFKDMCQRLNHSVTLSMSFCLNVTMPMRFSLYFASKFGQIAAISLVSFENILEEVTISSVRSLMKIANRMDPMTNP